MGPLTSLAETRVTFGAPGMCGKRPCTVPTCRLTTLDTGARPGLAALLDYARPGDAIVVVGIDRLGRNAAEVMTTIRELRDREIVLRSLREGIDTSNATGRMVAGVLASLAELELELGRERRLAAREARRARGQHIGRPKALDKSKAALARRMHTSGEPVSTIAAMLGVSRATVYRVLAEQTESKGEG